MGVGRDRKIWELDHTYDGMIPGHQIPPVSDKLDDFHFYSGKLLSSTAESVEEKKSRRRSHWVIYTTMFIVFTGFSIVISGIFPYLKLLENDSNLSKTNLGWVISANPLGATIASPLVGYLANRLGSVRNVAYLSMVVFCFANLVYGFLPAFVGLWDRSAFHIMLIARFFVGVSSGISVICRSYLAASTTIKERTGAFAILLAAQSLGYVIGPVIQMVLSLVLTEDMQKYQTTGFVSAILGVLNFVLLSPFVFTEFNIMDNVPTAKKQENYEQEENVSPKQDFPALFGIMFAFFISQLIYILLETLLEPFVQDQYAWCDDLAVITVGVILSATGVIFMVMFLVAAKLAKIFDERTLMIGLGIGVTIIGLLLLLPWGPNSLKYCPASELTVETLEYINRTEGNNTGPFSVQYDIYEEIGNLIYSYETESGLRSDIFNKFCGNVTECLGCPPEQTWCLDVPQLPFAQLIIAFTIVLTVFPVNMSMSNTIFSKMLGSRPQGTWMGVFTAVGSAARMIGPIYVSYVYVNLGTRYTFGILAFVLFIGCLELIYLYKRIVPMQISIKSNGKL